MSQYLNQAIAEAYSMQVKQAYQGSTNLRNYVDYAHAQMGIYHFRKMNKGLAYARSSQSKVIPSDTQYTDIPCITQKWTATDLTSIFSQSEVNFSEIKKLSKKLGLDLARREDQMIINAMANLTTASGPYVGDIASSIGTDAKLNLSKLREAAHALDKKGVPQTDRYFLLTAEGSKQLLSDADILGSTTEVVSNVRGDTGKNQYMSFKFCIINDREEGGLPATGTGTEVYGFAFHKDSIGLATSIDPVIKITYDPTRNCWITIGELDGNAVPIDGEGIVRVAYDNNL